MVDFAKASDFIGTHLHEAIKYYATYDASNRLEYTYVAQVETVNGGQCMKTQYVYDGTSTRVVKMKESKTTWNSAWDI